jgi:NTP pyrophosphatase (non-canonical NTP hydrolase)
MNLYDYQLQAMRTAVYNTTHAIMYPALGLAEEAGEVAGKIAKMLRDDIKLDDQKEKIEAEMGDVLWMLAALAKGCNLSLQTIAEKNLEKLAKRRDKGTLQGEGDER